MVDKRKVTRDVLEALGKRELARVRTMIESRTLRNAIRLIIHENEGRAELFIPHYWAVWYHDGRGPVKPVSARKLVFFDDPNDDPRLKGGYPVTPAQVKRLTKSQYQEGLRRNAERAARGLRPFMYVVDSVGASKSHRFFDRLAATADTAAVFDQTVTDAVTKELRRSIEEDPDLRSETRDIEFDL